MTTTEVTVRLRPDQLEAFHRDGFLALDALTTRTEVESLRGVYDRLFERRDGYAEGDQLALSRPDEAGRETLPQILNPEKYAPELADTLARTNALAIARQLLGPLADRAGDHAIMKPPGHGVATPWHQDEAYWSSTHSHRALSVWMPLQEATLDNGCMWFVPGSHDHDVRPHRLVDPDAHALEVAEDVPTTEAVACPIPAGGCTIHHCRTLHYAGPNHSAAPRRAFIMGFQLPPRPLAEARDFFWQRPEWHS